MQCLKIDQYMIVICKLVLAFMLLSLGGCATNGNSLFGVSKRLETAERVTLTGANPLVDSENFEEVNLEMLLDPTNIRNTNVYKPNIKKICGKDESETPEYDERTACINRAYLGAATNAFYAQGNELGTTIELRRNRIQDRLLASSEQRCGAYKQYLKAYDIHWETSLGIGTTILGAAGAIATGTLNTRVFSGLSAMLSGARSEIRQGVFSNLASFVIIPGIDLKRANVLAEIKVTRKLTISDYSVEAAMHDAFTYHNACTLESGLEVAQESIKRIENPGLAQINKTLATLTETKQLANMVELANKGALTAEKAKVVSVNYVPTMVELAGSGKAVAATADKAIENKTIFILAAFDATSLSVTALQTALETKAKDNATKEDERKKLLAVVARIETYITADSTNKKLPKDTFKSIRTYLQMKVNGLEKALLEYDVVIANQEIGLLNPAITNKADLQIAIAANKATKQTYEKLAVANLLAQIKLPLAAIAKLIAQQQHVESDFDLLDKQLAALSTISVRKPPTPNAIVATVAP